MKELLPAIIIKHKRPVKYLMAGGIAAFVDLSLLYLFTDVVGLWYLLSACLAFVVAFFVSFYLQKFWTFRDNDKERLYRQMFAYLAVALTNLILNTILMFILVSGFKLWYMLAQVLVSGLIACESYLVYKFFIFNRAAGRNFAPADKLKILVATGIYPPDIGGPATYAFYLRAELIKLGHEVAVVTYGRESKNDLAEKIYYISRRDNLCLRYWRFFISVLKQSRQADIIYVLDLVSAGLPAILAAALKGKRIVFRTGGDFLWEKAYQSGWTELPLRKYYQAKKSLKEKLLLALCRLLLIRLDQVIFSTEFQAEIYRRSYQLADKKISLVANPIILSEPAAASSQYGEAIISAGRLIKIKNFERLIRAFSRINNPVKLIIFGQGPDGDRLKKLIKDLVMDQRIEIKDSVNHEALIGYLSGCKFFVLPSITEISPNLALECLGLKKAVILTKETGLPEKLTERLITVDPLSEDDLKEKIEYLLKSENLAAYEQAVNNLTSEKWGWLEITAAHLLIFKEVLK